MVMKPKNNIYLAWETDEKGEPSGKERILNAPNAKWAANHIKYETKGEFLYPTNRCTTIKTPDGFRWYVKFYKKYEKLS